MVGTNNLSEQDRKELIKLHARMDDTKKRINKILQNVQLNTLPSNVNEGEKDFYEKLLTETKYDILIEEMVPPEALNFDKLSEHEKWCLVHNRMEEKQ